MLYILVLTAFPPSLPNPTQLAITKENDLRINASGGLSLDAMRAGMGKCEYFCDPALARLDSVTQYCRKQVAY